MKQCAGLAVVGLLRKSGGKGRMIVKVEVEHAIKTGKEREALELIKELNLRGLNRPANASWRGLLLQGDFREPETIDSYRDHLAALSRLSLLADTPAKIRVYMSV
jgi:hypothetical protein